MNIHRCLLSATMALAASAVPAVTFAVGGLIVDVGEDVTIDLSGSPNDSNDTAVRFQNLSQNQGELFVEFKPGPSLLPGQTVSDGFQLLDGTLIVTSDIPNGQKRVRYRMEYGRRDFQRLGLRADTARIMRLGEPAGARWIPAQRFIRRATRADIRRLRDRRADFTLGHYGFSNQASYAWAVIDVNSSYAVGAMPIPEPASWLLVLSGGSLLLFHMLPGRRRRKGL